MARKGTATVVGAGFYGSTTAQRLAEYDIFEKVVLTDIRDGWAEGLALDLNQSRPIEGFETQVVGKTTGTDGQRWWVEDLQSSNGTYVGGAGEPLPTTPLPPGQRVELADDDRVYVGAWTRIVVRRAAPGEI